LRQHLPRRVAMMPIWTLIFSLTQHGASMSTLYECVKNYQGLSLLLAVHTTNDELIGAYLSETLHISSTYYGSGESFLWQATPTSGLTIYRWTEANTYFIYSDRHTIIVGGGNGRCGLWLHEDLIHGNTEACATFGNPPLSKTGSFEYMEIELWGFVI
ncbi:TLDc domain-containing protein, partial [Radiomyces spectabilis]|uniref:TLDc domain-containing protein n=1 Tax=Radiomyces spectabilis TaxID=64574 RepID=UPI002220B08B